MNCREATRSFATDQQMSLAQRLSRFFHLLLCKGCRNFQAHLVGMKRAMRLTPKATNEEVEQVISSSLEAVKQHPPH